jgi:hypothetical protein
MKRIFALIMALMLIFAAGCSKEVSEEEPVTV